MCGSLGQTLRRGAGIIGTVLGDFFGVTEVSQRGNTADGRIGWEQYTERRVEEVRSAYMQCITGDTCKGEIFRSF